MAEERGLRSVHILPYQDMSRPGEVLSAGDLAVVCLGIQFTGMSVPSKTYGIMASEKAILALLGTESEIGRTIVQHDCAVALEDPSGNQVAQTIRALLRGPTKLRRWGENSYQAFRQHYTLPWPQNDTLSSYRRRALAARIR